MRVSFLTRKEVDVTESFSGYDVEYSQSPRFWKKEPSEGVVRLAALLNPHSNCLDLGCGEGRNLFYLSGLGHETHGMDISEYAIEKCKQSIRAHRINKAKVERGDVRDYPFENIKIFDAIISCGLLHCLNSIDEIYQVLRQIRHHTKCGAYHLIYTFNNQLPIPECQSYLKNEALLQPDALKYLYSDWELIFYKELILEDFHATSKVNHQHAVSKILARKI